MNLEPNSKNEYFFMFGLFVLGLVFYWPAIDTSVLSGPNLFHGRDLNRAFAFYRNQMIWHGPELTGGGQLPGPFYYFLLGLPLYFFDSYIATVYFTAIVASAGFVLIWKLVAQYSAKGAILAYFYFLSSTFMLNLVSIPWNPSFLVFFAALGMILLNNPKNNPGLFWGGFVLGLSLQIHYMQIIFILGSVIALAIEKFPLQVRLKKIATVLAGVLLPLIPYFAYRLFLLQHLDTDSNFAAGVESFLARAAGADPESAEHLRTMFLFKSSDILALPIALASLFFLKRAFQKNKFLAVTYLLALIPAYWVLLQMHLARYLFPAVLMSGLVATMMASENVSGKKWRYYGFFAMAAFLGFAIRFSVDPDFSIRFSMPMLQKYSLLLAVGVFIAIWFFQKKSDRAFFIILLLTTVANTSYVDELRAQQFYAQKDKAHFLRLEEGENLFREIITTTGWNYQQFREHTFIVSAIRWEDYSFLYSSMARKLNGVTPGSFDGLVVNTRLATNAKIPAEIKKSFATGEMSCRRETVVGNFSLCFYGFSNSDRARKINNIGYGYEYAQPALIDVKQSEGVHEVDRNRAVFYLNRCPDFEPSCNIFFTVTLHTFRLRLQALGDPIASVIPSVNPSYSVRYLNPALLIHCKKTVHKIEFASVLGFERYKSSVLAPFEADFDLPCKRPLKVMLSLPSSFMTTKDAYYGKEPSVELVWTPSEK